MIIMGVCALLMYMVGKSWWDFHKRGGLRGVDPEKTIDEESRAPVVDDKTDDFDGFHEPESDDDRKRENGSTDDGFKPMD